MSAATHASAIPAAFVGVSGVGATSSAAPIVAGRRRALAIEWETADIRPRHTHESCARLRRDRAEIYRDRVEVVSKSRQDCAVAARRGRAEVVPRSRRAISAADLGACRYA